MPSSKRRPGYQPPPQYFYETPRQYAANREQRYDNAYRTAYQDVYPQLAPNQPAPGRLPNDRLPRFSPGAQADYNEYKENTDRSKNSAISYHYAHDEAVANFDATFEHSDPGTENYRRDTQELSYYVSNTGALFPDQHRSLVQPACQASVDTLRMANSRRDFVERHPYAYRTLGERRRHENGIDGAYVQWEQLDQRAKRHIRYASDGRSPRRDRYGRRMPAQEADDDEEEQEDEEEE